MAASFEVAFSFFLIDCKSLKDYSIINSIQYYFLYEFVFKEL